MRPPRAACILGHGPHFKALPLVLLVWLALPLAAPPKTPPITQAELLRRTQELYDSLIPGDQTPWKKYFADDCLYHDEKGRGMDKAALVADVSPMPKGYTGAIKIVRPQSLFTGDCAILSYDLDEIETIFGQELHARYHTIDTWLHRGGDWQIAASQTMRYYEDPAAGTPDPTRWTAYAGTYELPGSDRKATISVEGDQLFMEKLPGKKTPLASRGGRPVFPPGRGRARPLSLRGRRQGRRPDRPPQQRRRGLEEGSITCDLAASCRDPCLRPRNRPPPARLPSSATRTRARPRSRRNSSFTAARCSSQAASPPRRKQRATTSDWMELEKQRGISVSSTVLQFDYSGYRVNLLDTPRAHQDFSEDTYRVLTAVDAAIMVIDAGQGH